MGFTQLSMNPLSIPAIRRVIQQVPIEASRRIAEHALRLTTSHEVYAYLTESVTKLVSMDLNPYAKEIAPPA